MPECKTPQVNTFSLPPIFFVFLGRYPVSLDVQRWCTGTKKKKCVNPPLWTNQLKCWMKLTKIGPPAFWKHPRVMVLSSIMLYHSFCVPVLYVYHTFNHEFCRETFGKCVVFDEVERLAKCLQNSQSINPLQYPAFICPRLSAKKVPKTGTFMIIAPVIWWQTNNVDRGYPIFRHSQTV